MSVRSKVAKIVEKAVQDASVQQGKGAEHYASQIISVVQKAKK